MSEETNDRLEEEATGDERRGPVCGERLAGARRAQQITVLEIAKELHLDEPKVRALERNDFDVIGAAVFAKGHLRKYAQLVKVDEADLMLDYYQLNRSAAMPQVVSTRPKLRRDASSGPWIAAFSVIVIAGATYWWFAGGTTITESAATAEISALPQESAADTPTEMDAPEETNNSGLPEPTTALLVEAIGEPSDAATGESGVAGLRMTLSYSGDCWTEITDANGSRLFFDLGTSGRRVVLSGEAPFNVLFGNVENVRIQVNGLPYTIPAADRSGRTARLTISGS
jgi:cytoskeleton protein RodZ